MPKLQAVLENIEDAPESAREFYKETQDKDNKTWYVLELSEDVKNHPSVVALQRAHERQKEENKTLKAENVELKKKSVDVPEGFDPDEFERLKEVEKQLNDLKSKGGGDPKADEAHKAEIASFKKTHEQQVAKLTKAMEEGFKERDTLVERLTGRMHNMVVHDGLVRLLAENGVKKDVLPFVQAKLERNVKVVENDDGEPVMVFNTDLGEIPATDYVPKWTQSDEAKPFVELAAGGGAMGGTRKGGGYDGQNPWSKAFWNMARQHDILTKDPSKADRMAKAAGHKKAPGALILDAK